jgi:hypothetical protein
MTRFLRSTDFLPCARIVFVKTLLRSLVVWFMLLAMPVQGFASVTKLLCVPLSSASSLTAPTALATGHDHHAMLIAEAVQDGHADAALVNAVQGTSDDQKSAGHHAGTKCKACAAYCSSAVLPPSPIVGTSVDSPQIASLHFDLGALPSVDLAVPKRPPKASLT